MAICTAKELLMKSAKEKYSVGAFNITNILQMQAVIDAAENKKSPVIIQTSVSPSQTIGPDLVVASFSVMANKVSVNVALHLDHCTDVEYCKVCIDAGYTNIMFDGSAFPYEENVKKTKEICDYAHKKGGVSVEGELGKVVGVEDEIIVGEGESTLCDPEQVMDFIKSTDVDILAPAIGTAHGFYTTKNPVLDFDLLAKVHQMVNGDQIRVPLVIHGGTGLTDEVVRKLVRLGGSKFNVSTDLKHTLLDATYNYIHANRNEYNPGKVDKAVNKAIIEKVERWIDLLGSASKNLTTT